MNHRRRMSLWGKGERGVLVGMGRGGGVSLEIPATVGAKGSQVFVHNIRGMGLIVKGNAECLAPLKANPSEGALQMEDGTCELGGVAVGVDDVVNLGHRHGLKERIVFEVLHLIRIGAVEFEDVEAIFDALWGFGDRALRVQRWNPLRGAGGAGRERAKQKGGETVRQTFETLPPNAAWVRAVMS